MKSKPLIGMTMRTNIATQDFYLRREYSEAIEEAGGIPVHIPLIPKIEYLSALAESLDGVLLPGSDSDVDPLRYGEEPHKNLGNVHPLRDETDLLLLASADKLNLPVLGICFGMQSLNVFRGGSLIQDINVEIPNSLKHQQGELKERHSHYLELETDSLLSRLAARQNKILVNSHHHQSICSVGRNLRVTARASDKVIEAIEDTRLDKFIIGVQWHPELNWRNDTFSQNIFKAFIEAAVRMGLDRT